MRTKLTGGIISLVGLFMVFGLVRGQVQLDSTTLGTQAQIDAFTAEKKNEFKRVMQGEREYQTADKALLDMAAQYFVYRVTFLTTQRDRELLNKVRDEFRIETDSAAKYKDAAAKQFAKSLLACFGEVFKLSFDKNRLAHTNAALMLPGLAQLKSEEVGDFLAGLIADPKTHDAVRVYALRALGEFFRGVPPMEQTIVKGDKLRLAKDPKRIEALLDVINRKWDLKKVDPAAAQYIRRDAVKALAQARIPAVEVTKTKVTAPAVVGLLRVLAVPPVLEPPPSVGEKLEAAIGICQLKIDAAHDLFIPEIGIYRAARGLNEVVRTYHQDFQSQFGGVGKKVKNPVMPWKYEAERVKQALKELVTATSAKEGALDRARRLDEKMQPFLKAMATHQGVGEDLNNLNELVNGLRADGSSVFKTVEAPIGD